MPMSLINQRVVYLNGVYVPENEAVVPIKDQGFKYGDGVWHRFSLIVITKLIIRIYFVHIYFHYNSLFLKKIMQN